MSNDTNAPPVPVDYTTVLADLRAKRAQLDAAIAAIEQLQGLPVSAPGEGSPAAAVRQPEQDVRDDSFFGMSIPDSTRKFLTMRKRPMATQEIADALQRGGLTTLKPDTFANTVGSVLNRLHREDGGVVKVGRAKWGLAEWYPARKKGKKQNGDEADDDGKET